MTYQTKVVGIIATDDFNILAETSFRDDYIEDDNLGDLLDALADNRVLNYTPDFEIDDYQEATYKLADVLPEGHYFIAIETPVTYKPNKTFPTKCYSWGYTQTTWVFIDSLANIDKYRQIVGKMADDTLEDKN